MLRMAFTDTPPIISLNANAFPYSQPPLTELLVLLSFLYLLNVVRVGADYFLHAGVVAMIALGTIYGTPLAAILPQDWESTFTAIGYLGLVGIVFEGGLSTNLSLLFSNAFLSLLCAAIGIILPIALSFALLTGGYGYAPLESFAAGAALASTSLGTTLMALNSVSRTDSSTKSTPKDGLPTHERSGQAQELTDPPNQVKNDTSVSSEPKSLRQTRIGTVLISAAVIDDVIGLVLAAMIPAFTALNTDEPQSNLAWTIARPLLSSVLMTIITPVVARYILRPLFWYKGIGERWCSPARLEKPWGARVIFGISSENSNVEGWGTQMHADVIKLMLMALFVSAFSAIAFYTGSSILFGVYLAGCVLSYISQPPSEVTSLDENEVQSRLEALSFEHAFSRLAGPIQQYLMTPLFFASIGFAIPFVALWDPKVLWRGMLYSLAMGIAKLAAGIPIIVSTIIVKDNLPETRRERPLLPHLYRSFLRLIRRDGPHASPIELSSSHLESSAGPSRPTRTVRTPAQLPLMQRFQSSLVPAFFMGSAMVARGEIGLLIAQIAKNGSEHESNGEGLLSDEAFLVCIWAILLCTLVGPISVGFVIRWWGPRVSSGIWR